MKDSDLIEKIKSVDGEELKRGLIEELEAQEKMSRDYSAIWWNAFRSCLAGALWRIGVEVPGGPAIRVP